MFHARFNAIKLSDVALSGRLQVTDYHLAVIYDTCPDGAVGSGFYSMLVG